MQGDAGLDGPGGPIDAQGLRQGSQGLPGEQGLRGLLGELGVLGLQGLRGEQGCVCVCAFVFVGVECKHLCVAIRRHLDTARATDAPGALL